MSAHYSPPVLPFLDESRAPAKRRPIFATLLFALALVVLSRGVGRVIDEQPRVRLGEKLSWGDQTLPTYLEQRESFDGLFVGTSRMQRALIPSSFDEILARSNVAVRTMNLARPGMHFLEMRELVRRVLEWQPRSVKWMVIDLDDLDPAYRSKNRGGKRLIGWHTPRATLDAWCILWESERDLFTKLTETYEHLTEFAPHLANVGLGHVVIADRFGNYEPALDGGVARTLGYTRYSSQAVVSEEDFANSHRYIRPYPGRSDERSMVQSRIVLELDAEIRANGIVPIWIRMPGFNRECGVMALAESGLLPNFIDLHDREAYSELYSRELFQDKHHVNEVGAEYLTGLVAEAVLRLYEDGTLKAAITEASP